MHFSHHPELWRAFPSLAAGVMQVSQVDHMLAVPTAVETHLAQARARLAATPGDSAEGSWPEIQAWRRTFAQMGLKPTQVRCAAEALLRRLRKEGTLPSLHPLVDLCNALSARWAVPIAVFDVARVGWPLQVRRADGSERYEAFTGEIEAPDLGEVVFADLAGHAHARRWAHRQSRRSAVQPGSRQALIVAEAFHDGAPQAIQALLSGLAAELQAAGATVLASARLSAAAPVFDGAGD